MKNIVTLTLLSGSLLSGCAVTPYYDGPVVVAPPAVVAPAPVYVAPAPAIVVRPSFGFGFSYYRDYGGPYWRHRRM